VLLLLQGWIGEQYPQTLSNSPLGQQSAMLTTAPFRQLIVKYSKQERAQICSAFFNPLYNFSLVSKVTSDVVHNVNSNFAIEIFRKCVFFPSQIALFVFSCVPV
jgi:hypothetical protein